MYALRASNGMWVKFTCKFGYFHGSVVLTEDPALARKWTREYDANRARLVADHRFSEKFSTEFKKYGELSFTVVQVLTHAVDIPKGG